MNEGNTGNCSSIEHIWQESLPPGEAAAGYAVNSQRRGQESGWKISLNTISKIPGEAVSGKGVLIYFLLKGNWKDKSSIYGLYWNDRSG